MIRCHVKLLDDTEFRCDVDVRNEFLYLTMTCMNMRVYCTQTQTQLAYTHTHVTRYKRAIYCSYMVFNMVVNRCCLVALSGVYWWQ